MFLIKKYFNVYFSFCSKQDLLVYIRAVQKNRLVQGHLRDALMLLPSFSFYSFTMATTFHVTVLINHWPTIANHDKVVNIPANKEGTFAFYFPSPNVLRRRVNTQRSDDYGFNEHTGL